MRTCKHMCLSTVPVFSYKYSAASRGPPTATELPNIHTDIATNSPRPDWTASCHSLTARSSHPSRYKNNCDVHTTNSVRISERSRRRSPECGAKSQRYALQTVPSFAHAFVEGTQQYVTASISSTVLMNAGVVILSIPMHSCACVGKESESSPVNFTRCLWKSNRGDGHRGRRKLQLQSWCFSHRGE